MVKLINPYTRKTVDSPEENVDRLLSVGFRRSPVEEPRRRPGRPKKK